MPNDHIRLLEEREHLNEEAKLAALRLPIAEGDRSGIAEGDVFVRMRELLGLRNGATGEALEH